MKIKRSKIGSSDALIKCNGVTIGRLRGVRVEEKQSVLNDQAYIDSLDLSASLEGKHEEYNAIVSSRKEKRAIKAAGELVGEMMQSTGRKDFFGWWRRVEKAEQAALIAAGKLSDMALKYRDANECAHWCRVRIAIRARSYQ